MARQLDETILDGGIRNTHFFNGRWLTAEDLRTEQEANREHHRQLGRAIGDGVVQGLDVELADAGSGGRVPRVTVSAGLAFNRRGEALALAQGVELALARQQDGIPVEAELFAPCTGQPAGDLILTGTGAYILALCPASGFRERAPGRELGDERTLTGCGSRYAVEGVRFRLVRLPLSPGSGAGEEVLAPIRLLLDRQDDLGRSLLRNHLAHLCLGTARLAALEVDPFGTTLGTAFGIAALRSVAGLGDGDVPLALLVWTAQGVRILDPWPVRRPVAVEGTGPAYARFDPRFAAGQARLLQLHDHLRALLQGTTPPSNLKVEQVFRYLPPAGLVPLASARFSRGFSGTRFFSSFAGDGARSIRSGQVAELLWESFLHPAIDLEQAPFIQVYEVRESLSAQTGSQPPQPFLLYAARTLRYAGAQPRFPHLCQTLTQTRDAYRELLTRRVFDTAEEPDWFTPVATPVFARSNLRTVNNAASFTSILPRSVGNALVDTARDASYLTAAILDVMSTAGSWAAVACAALTDPDKILEALRQLYLAQKELVEVFESGPITHVTKPQDFARALLVYLDDRIPNTQPVQLALKPALDAGNAAAALNVQDAINRLVAQWSGDVTLGSLTVLFQSSSRGRTLVPGDTEPFEFTFRVANLTNRDLDVQLAAEALPPEWTPAVRIFDTTGIEVPFVHLSAGRTNPSAPGVSQDVRLSLVTPSSATLGQTATLRLRASVPSPVSVSSQDAVLLTVGPVAVPDDDGGLQT